MTCLLISQSGQEYKTGCGITLKDKTLPEDISGWSHQVNCPLCVSRQVTLRKVETHEELITLLDLDNPEVARQFHFAGKRFGFRWLIGTPLIYVYGSQEAAHASQAFPIQNFVPDVIGREATFEDAAAAAKQWVIFRGDMFGDDGNARAGSSRPTRAPSAPRRRPQMTRQALPPKPVIPEGYDGPLCAACGKHDEGDFVPNPKNMLEEVCMVCLVGGKV